MPCSSLGSLPWIQSCKHFASVGPSHRLPFCRNSAWALSVGCNHSGKGCSGVGTPRATGPARSVLQCGLSRVAGTPACSGGGLSAVSLRGGAACLAVAPAAGCRGICSERETPPPSAPSLTWVRVELSPPCCPSLSRRRCAVPVLRAAAPQHRGAAAAAPLPPGSSARAVGPPGSRRWGTSGQQLLLSHRRHPCIRPPPGPC